MTAMVVTPVSGALGAEVTGVDLAGGLDDTLVARLRALLAEHLVLFFPGQHLTPGQHRDFAARFGPLERSRFHRTVDEDHPEVSVLSADQSVVADVWHADQTYLDTPNVFGSLQMVTCPARGGDTMWTNQYLAYERLSAPLRRLLDELTAVHTSALQDGHVAEHPAVLTHPETGRRALFVSVHHVHKLVELTAEESRPLLDYLARHATRPEHTCRYRWSPGTVNIWDNRCTQHYVVNDFTGQRLAHRVTVLDPAAAAESAPMGR